MKNTMVAEGGMAAGVKNEKLRFRGKSKLHKNGVKGL